MTAAYAEAYGAWPRRVQRRQHRAAPSRTRRWYWRQAFDERCKGRDLAQFLVAPVQRVPRYRLLEALVLRTNEDHAGGMILTKCHRWCATPAPRLPHIRRECVRNEMQLLKSQIHDPTNQLSSL